jgi:hypothetical protein
MSSPQGGSEDLNRRIASVVLAASIGAAACLGYDKEHIEQHQYRAEPLPTTGILNYTPTAHAAIKIPLNCFLE